MHACSVIYYVLFIISRHSGIQIKLLSTLCFLKHLKNGILFVHMPHACILMDTLAVRKVQCAAYKKFFIQVIALPKLMLCGKYGTQRVVLRWNIPHGFILCYICDWIYKKGLYAQL